MGAIVYLVVLVLVFVPALISSEEVVYPLIMSVVGLLAGMVGVVMGWLACTAPWSPYPRKELKRWRRSSKRYAKLRADCASNP